MKNTLAFVIIFLCVVMINAQNSTIVNNSFENWSSSESTEQPNGWTTGLIGNVLVEIFGQPVPIPINTYFGSKSTDTHSGSFALKVQSKEVGIAGTSYSYPFPGMVQYGVCQGFNIPLSAISSLVDLIGNVSSGDSTGFNLDDLDYESLATLEQALARGDALSQTPAHLNLWVKFQPSGDDALSVFAFSKLGGAFVGTAEYSTTESFDEYTQISIPFDNALAPCDSLAIIIIGGSASSNAETVLWIDDVTVDFTPDGVETHNAHSFTLSPNPTQGQFFIAPQDETHYSYAIYDMQGREVYRETNCAGVVSVNTVKLLKGVYCVMIDQNGKRDVKKIVIR